MSASDPLVEFIEARIADDEATALAAPPGPWRADGFECCVLSNNDGETILETSCMGHDAREPVVRHAVRHDPARVLRGVDAKLQAIELWESNLEWSQNPACPSSQRDHYRDMAMGMRDMLEAMAGEWVNHEDYRQGWAA